MFEFKNKIIIINFLNREAMKLLEVVSEESPIRSIKLWNKICKNNGKHISRSTYYRYIDLLVSNKLIDKSKYRKKIGGHKYEINDKGKLFLKFFYDSDIEFYNKLCIDPDKQKFN